MRRWAGPVFVLIGTALLVLGLLAIFWIGPSVRRAPIDQRSRTVSTGTGTYYDFAAGEEVESDQIESVINTESDQTVYEGEDPISDDIGVYDQTSGLFDRGAGLRDHLLRGPDRDRPRDRPAGRLLRRRPRRGPDDQVALRDRAGGLPAVGRHAR